MDYIASSSSAIVKYYFIFLLTNLYISIKRGRFPLLFNLWKGNLKKIKHSQHLDNETFTCLKTFIYMVLSDNPLHNYSGKTYQDSTKLYMYNLCKLWSWSKPIDSLILIIVWSYIAFIDLPVLYFQNMMVELTIYSSLLSYKAIPSVMQKCPYKRCVVSLKRG